MDDLPILTRLACPACSWQAICGDEEIDIHLRGAGMLRRQAKTDHETLEQLLAGAGPRLTCPECGHRGLTAETVTEEDLWQDAVLCEICRQPIPPERLEAIPGTRRCTSCQNDSEHGRLAEEPEFCPRCGAVLVLRMSKKGGTTRFRLFCTGSPPCRL